MPKDKKGEAWTQSHVINHINLTLRSKVKVISGSWMYLTHPLLGIDQSAKYGMPMSKLTEITGWTSRHDKNSKNLTLRSKFKVLSGSWMYVTHRLMVIHPCAKYGMPMSNQKKSYGPDTKTGQKLYKFDLEVKVQGRIWIMNVHDTSSYGDAPMYQIW